MQLFMIQDVCCGGLDSLPRMRRIDSDFYKVLELKSHKVALKGMKLSGLANFHLQIRLMQASKIRINSLI